MEIPMSGDYAASEVPRDLLVRTVVAKVKSTSTVDVVFRINHTIRNALSINAWGKDVEALMFGAKILERIPHKVFAEAYYLHQISLAAKMAADHHFKGLRGIGSMHHPTPSCNCYFRPTLREALNTYLVIIHHAQA